jgi:hypothetical protein
MNNICVIIPVYKLVEESDKKMFERAYNSIKTQKTAVDKVLVVYDKESDENYLKSFDFELLLNNTEKTDFCSQVNLAAEYISGKYSYFSVLEYDDEYSKIWFKNVYDYIKEYPLVDVFLPMIIDVKDDGSFIGFTNESTWAYGFSDEQGFLDNETLQRYPNFNISGMVIRTETFISIGKLKPSMKLSFIYEFMLRATHNSALVFTIPKIGYKHINFREGSLFETYKNDMDDKEKNFWMKLAKEEQFFDYDREKVYQ